MRKTLLLLSLTLFYTQSFSQQDSLLKQFKYRITRFRAATINASAGGEVEKRQFGSGNQTNSGSAGGFSAGLFTSKSTDRILLNTNSSVALSYSAQKSEAPGNTGKNRAVTAATQFNVLNKWFSGKSFLELGADITAGFFSSKSSQTSIPPPLFSRNKEYAITLRTGIGTGRLENITDMQNALWLSQALNKTGRLTRSLSADEMMELGRSITKGNNTRVLDARRRTQFVLETTDQYLQEKKLISKNDITYFSNLNDILFFAFNNFRMAGKEKFIRITPSLSGFSNAYDQTGNIQRVENNPSIKSAFLNAGLQNYIPVSLTHQNNYGVSLKAGLISYRSTLKFFNNNGLFDELKLQSDIRQAGVILFYEHAFYPNTRTNITIGLMSDAGYQDADTESMFYWQAMLNGTLNYFISYRTRLFGNISGQYLKNFYDTYQNLQLYPDNLLLRLNAGISIGL